MHPMTPHMVIFATMAVLVSLAIDVHAGEFGAFSAVEDRPGVLVLDGSIEGTMPLDFRRALRAHPETKLVLLNSPGGLVDTALVVAHEIRDRGLSTFIPAQAGCYSACVYLYLAGVGRRADGELGVHQLYNDTNDLRSGQTILSDVLEALDEFGTPREIISRMLRTPPDSIYVFSQVEIASLGLNVGEPLKSASIDQLRTILETPPPENIVRDLGPENLTVMPQTKSADTGTSDRSEVLFELTENAELAAVLLNNGFTEQTAEMMTGTVRNVLKSLTLPRGALLRLLFGPSRASDTLIPYRMTIYFPDANGEPTHVVTAALTDRGSYVLGLPPRTIIVEGRTLVGSETADPPGGQPGKQDRLRPHASP